MDDRQLAEALDTVDDLERKIRRHWTERRAQQDLAEADAALVALRLVTPVLRSLETWMNTRACRAARQQPAQRVG